MTMDLSWLNNITTFVAESAAETTVLILMGGGFVIGALSVVLGGGMFFSVPLMQWLFPGVTFGAIVGNIKMGSLFRSIGSTFSTHEHIEYRRNFGIVVLAVLGTVFGAMLISHLSQIWLLPAILFAILIVELAPRFAHLITNRTFHVASFLAGLYAGTFSAGIGIMLVALVRLKHSEDTSIAHVKVQARFVEFLLTIVAVLTHSFLGNLIPSIWIPWAIGSIAGGIVGGLLLSRMTTLSGKIQKAILRASYVVTVLTAWGST